VQSDMLPPISFKNIHKIAKRPADEGAGAGGKPPKTKKKRPQVLRKRISDGNRITRPSVFTNASNSTGVENEQPSSRLIPTPKEGQKVDLSRLDEVKTPSSQSKGGRKRLYQQGPSRSWKTKKSDSQSKKEKLEKEMKKEEERQSKAAVKIQSKFRGIKGRKQSVQRTLSKAHTSMERHFKHKMRSQQTRIDQSSSNTLKSLSRSFDALDALSRRVRDLRKHLTIANGGSSNGGSVGQLNDSLIRKMVTNAKDFKELALDIGPSVDELARKLREWNGLCKDQAEEKKSVTTDIIEKSQQTLVRRKSVLGGIEKKRNEKEEQERKSKEEKERKLRREKKKSSSNSSSHASGRKYSHIMGGTRSSNRTAKRPNQKSNRQKTSRKSSHSSSHQPHHSRPKKTSNLSRRRRSSSSPRVTKTKSVSSSSNRSKSPKQHEIKIVEMFELGETTQQIVASMYGDGTPTKVKSRKGNESNRQSRIPQPGGDYIKKGRDDANTSNTTLFSRSHQQRKPSSSGQRSNRNQRDGNNNMEESIKLEEIMDHLNEKSSPS